jgi:hypothetical protein
MSSAAQTSTATQPAAASVADCDRPPWADQVQGQPAGFDAGDKCCRSLKMRMWKSLKMRT